MKNIFFLLKKKKIKEKNFEHFWNIWQKMNFWVLCHNKLMIYCHAQLNVCCCSIFKNSSVSWNFFLGHIKMMINIHNQFLLPFVSIIRDLLASFLVFFFKSNITEFINVRWRKICFSIIEKLCWNFKALVIDATQKKDTNSTNLK